MAEKQIGIKFDVKSTGLVQVDDALETISKNLKGLNENVIQQQQKGWGSEAQTKELREQMRYMQQVLQLTERMARMQGVHSDSFGSFNREIGMMQRDLGTVPTYRSGVSGAIHNAYGAKAAQGFEKISDAIGKLSALYGGFSLFSTIQSGLSRGDQLAYGLGDFSKRMYPSNYNSLGYGRGLLSSLQGYGYDDLGIMQAVNTYGAAAGSMNQNTFQSQMQTILSFGRQFGMSDPNQVAQIFAGAFSSGATGGSTAQMQPKDFANLIGNAVAQANMQGKQGQLISQMQQLTQMTLFSMGQAGDQKTIAALLAMGDRTGNQALIGNLPGMFGGIDQAIKSPNGGWAGQAMMMSAIGQGKMGYWQEQYQQSLGAFGVNPNNGKSNIENATDYFMGVFKGDKYEQAVRLGQSFNLSPAQAMQFIETYTQGGKFKSDALNTLKSQMGQQAPNIPQNNTDNYRNNSMYKQYGADSAGMSTTPERSWVDSVTGGILNDIGGPLIDIGMIAMGVKGAGTVLNFGKNFLPKGGASTAANAGKSGAGWLSRLFSFGRAGAGAAAGAAEAGALGAELAGPAALEVAGAGLDATGIGAPVGIALGLAGLGWGAYEWGKKYMGSNKQSTDSSASSTQMTDTSSNSTQIDSTNSVSTGQQLAPIVASTIVALAPYMGSLKSYLGGSSTDNKTGISLLPNGTGIPKLDTSLTTNDAWKSGFTLTGIGGIGSRTREGGGGYSASGSYSPSGDVNQAISYWSQQYGVPEYISYAIAMAESSLDPSKNPIDSNGVHSTGLFQLNQKGQGKGYFPEVLKDPWLNSKIGIGNLADAYKKGKAQGLSGADLAQYVAENSGHPGYGVHTGLDDNIRANAQGILDGKIKIEGASITVNVKQPDNSTTTHQVPIKARIDYQ